MKKPNTTTFIRFAWCYVAVFACSTVAGVLFRFTEERLGLLWRGWLTRRATRVYIENQLYLHLGSDETLSNPDQRITEDIKQLTTTTLSFVLMVANGTLTVLSFSGVLWAISPKRFVIAVVYALAGSGLAVWLGRPLIRMNYIQLIPVIIVAPLFIRRQVEFGIIGQAAMAFSTLLGAFSLIIKQFQAISSYAAVVARLDEFAEYSHRYKKEKAPACWSR